MPTWSALVRNYFTFNRRERKGLATLIATLIVLSSVHLAIIYWPADELTRGDREILGQLVMKPITQAGEHELKADEQNMAIDDSSAIDPITVSQSELVSSGLSGILAERWVKYRNAGGQYRQLADIKKLYGMDTVWLVKNAHRLQFSETAEEEEKTAAVTETWNAEPLRKDQPKPLFELNTADSAQLESLPFVGPFFAKSIVKLRTDLGGFHHYNQLREVYRMNDQAFEAIKSRTTLDPTLIVAMPLNQATIDELAAHPYLEWKQAKVIVNYRTHHGPYRSVSDLLKTNVLSDSVVALLAPYLSL